MRALTMNVTFYLEFYMNYSHLFLLLLSAFAVAQSMERIIVAPSQSQEQPKRG
jgi:hypothetical protein